ncbi:MAG: hypothetical protein ACLR8U_15460 [Oscillospiraceae bacterium]
MPDLDKMQLSELLGVSTDYLLKNGMDTPEQDDPKQAVWENAPAKRVTREEASRFLSLQAAAVPRVSLVWRFACVVSDCSSVLPRWALYFM